MHIWDEMNIEELIVRLRIEEVNNDLKEMFYYICGNYNCDKIGHNKNHKANVGELCYFDVSEECQRFLKRTLSDLTQGSGRLTLLLFSILA